MSALKQVSERQLRDPVFWELLAADSGAERAVYKADGKTCYWSYLPPSFVEDEHSTKGFAAVAARVDALLKDAPIAFSNSQDGAHHYSSVNIVVPSNSWSIYNFWLAYFGIKVEPKKDVCIYSRPELRPEQSIIPTGTYCSNHGVPGIAMPAQALAKVIEEVIVAFRGSLLLQASTPGMLQLRTDRTSFSFPEKTWDEVIKPQLEQFHAVRVVGEKVFFVSASGGDE